MKTRKFGVTGAALNEDLERGRYGDAARTRADLNRDYYRRDQQLRDIHHDERFRNGWR